MPTEEPTLEPEPFTTEAPEPNTLTECGQTIKADSGFIQYKLNRNYNAGELCTFLIKMDQYGGCDFTLLSHGISNTSSDTFTLLRVTGAEENLQSVKLERINPPAYLSASTFAVVFKTTTNLGTGFRLRFQSRTETSSKIPGKLLVFNNQTTTSLEFPLLPFIPRIAEWDAVVVTSDAKLLTDPETTLQLQLHGYLINPDCDTWYAIHSFDDTSPTFEGRTCTWMDKEAKALTFNTKGLFIVVFFMGARLTENYLGSMEWFETTSNATKIIP